MYTKIVSFLMDILSYRRAAGVISQKDGNQGDSTQRTSLFYTILKYLGFPNDDLMRDIDKGYLDDIAKHEVESGIYRRSPDPFFWGYDPRNLSRDQLAMVRCSFIAFNQYGKMWATVWQQIKRLGFHQNFYRNGVDPELYSNKFGLSENDMKLPDISSPLELSIIIRGMMPTWLLYVTIIPYILLNVFDFFKLFDNQLSSMNNYDSDHLAVIGIITCNKKCPTIFSKLAWRFYDKERAKKQIRRYFSPMYSGVYPLGELYCYLIDMES